MPTANDVSELFLEGRNLGTLYDGSAAQDTNGRLDLLLPYDWSSGRDELIDDAGHS